MLRTQIDYRRFVIIYVRVIKAPFNRRRTPRLLGNLTKLILEITAILSHVCQRNEQQSVHHELKLIKR